MRVTSSDACAAANVRSSTAANSVEDWDLPEGAALEDGSVATVELAGEPSSALVLRGFGLALKESARVVGIAVDVTRHSVRPDSIADHALRLVKDGLMLAGDRALPGAWAASFAQATHGGPTDLWDATWTAAEINDPSLGVALRVRAEGTRQGQARVDAVRCASTTASELRSSDDRGPNRAFDPGARR